MVHLPTTIVSEITLRVTSLTNQLSATPNAEHFADAKDPALRWNRALLQARLNELAWIQIVLGISSPTKTLH